MERWHELAELRQKVQAGVFRGINLDEAFELINLDVYQLLDLWSISSSVNKILKKEVDLCASLYVDSRPCPEDCSFCPLSARHYFSVDGFKTTPREKIVETILKFARDVKEEGISHFKIVTTGLETRGDVFPLVKEGIREAKNFYPEMKICISGGVLSKERLKELKSVGLDIYNNNLEAAANFYSVLVHTHNQQQKINAIKTAQELGLKVCCGGIVGAGETMRQRVQLAIQLRDLKVDSSPFNLVVKYPGLPISENGGKELTEIEILHTLALFRLILPQTRIVLGAGRTEYLSPDFQKLALTVGASAFQASGYFSKSTLRVSVKQDYTMFESVLRSASIT